MISSVAHNSFWSRRRVLITGHTGFKGAWLSLWLERLGADVIGLSLPPEHADGAFAALTPWNGLRSYTVDIRDWKAVDDAVQYIKPELAFHLAAQSLVHRGYTDPATTYATNVVGTSHVLEALARASSIRAIVAVTSDKVYANPGQQTAFTEDRPLGGNDPYSASKAAAELVVKAWHVAHPEVPVATARAGNVVGGGDTGEDRLLPDAWKALRAGQPLRLRFPRATRPWQFVLEPLRGYLALAERLAEAKDYPCAVNFGPNLVADWTVAHVVERAFALWGGGQWTTDSGQQPHEALSLSLDSSLAARTLRWQPLLDVDTAIQWTVQWWRAYAAGEELRPLALQQIDAYEAMDAAA